MDTNDPIGEVSSWNWQKTLHYHHSLSALRRFESDKARQKIDTSSVDGASVPQAGTDSSGSATTPNVRRHDTVVTT